jgi:hypothetical protein
LKGKSYWLNWRCGHGRYERPNEIRPLGLKIGHYPLAGSLGLLALGSLRGDIGEDEMERVAECHCGQLRAITSGEPGSVYVCHCKACQRRTGAVIHNGSRWLKSQVRIEGEHKIYGRIADSGFEIRFHFCPNCGSSVFWEGDRSPTTCGIAVGCFAEPNFPTPTSSGWEESMHPWLGLPPDTARFRQSRS